VEKVAPSSFSQNRSVSFGALLTALLILPVSPLPAQQFGGIRGQVVESDFGQPIARASVTLMDTPFGAMTDDQGNFTISGIAPGIYTLQIRASGFLPKIVPEATIAAGSFNDLRIEAIAEIEEMEELVVPGEIEKASETGLLAERQEITSVADAIGADLIAKVGAATAGAAMKRMVGTSVVDDRYVVVRGLSDRYVNTFLNGGRLPSSDPDKRAVNVDLFPGSVLESILTKKTFTPDLPGDFTGGSVDIRTKNYPEKPSFGASYTMEYNSQASFNPNFLSYNGGGTGPFGFRANQRLIPESVTSLGQGVLLPPAVGRSLDVAVPGDLDKAIAINNAMRQLTPDVAVTRKTVGPNTSINLQGGDSVEFGPEQKAGVLGAFSYRHKFNYFDNGQRNNYDAVYNPISKQGRLDPQFTFHQTQGTEDVLWGGLINMAGQPSKDHRLGANVMYSKAASDIATFNKDPSISDRNFQQQTISYGERDLLYFQARGDHLIKAARSLKVEWNGGLGQSGLVEPDNRVFQNEYNPITDVYKPLPQQEPLGTLSADPLQRFQRTLTDNSYYTIADFTVPFFEEEESNDSSFKTGFYYDYAGRTYDQFSGAYYYGEANTPEYETFGQPTIFGPDPTGGKTWAEVFLNEERSGLVNPAGTPPPGNDKPLSWALTDTTGSSGSSYQAQQTVIASYVMTDFRIFKQLKLTGGARFENTYLETSGDGGADTVLFPSTSGIIKQLDLLPAVAASFELAKDLNLRFAWSQTLARPSFKELGPVITQDFADSTLFIGNTGLKLSHANNYDFRAEWFPRAGEVLAVSVFYKELSNPIEQSIFLQGGLQYYQYRNNPEATVWGAEFEVRKRLDQVASWLRDFSVTFNFTQIQSQVTLTDFQRLQQAAIGIFESTRPLQGQPNYITNAGLEYNNVAYDFYAGLFFNVTGPMLYAVGADLPSIFEQPAPSLDLNLTQGFAQHWKFTFRAKNLLNPIFRRTITYNGQEEEYSSYTKGWDLSMNVSYSF
jgi:outer membrane receptor protein involved in Fe transport